METARCAVEVVAGVLPGEAMSEFTKQYVITSADWNAEGADQSALLADLNGRAQGYAGLLMLQPDRFNWVKTEWIWF